MLLRDLKGKIPFTPNNGFTQGTPVFTCVSIFTACSDFLLYMDDVMRAF